MFFVFLAALLAIVLLAELVRRMMRWSAEATRKLVHILVGLLIATTPYIFVSKWPMVFLGLLFTIIDYVAVRKNLLQGMHGTGRHTWGTVFYPISFVILVLLLWDNGRAVLVIAMLIMALSDAFAAIVGERARNPIILRLGPEVKSLQGSTAMFLTTLVILIACLMWLPFLAHRPGSFGVIFWYSILVSFVATAGEAVSKDGSDNLSVPMLSAFTLYYLLNGAPSDAVNFTLGVFLAVVVAAISFRLKFLDAGGSVTTFLLATIVFGVGRWQFSLPILAFFVLSSLLSKVGRNRKIAFVGIFEKSSRRDMWQVLANGGLAGLLVVLWYFVGGDWIYILYLGSLTAVTADTWGTELGVLTRSHPRSILTLKPVKAGTSGGISAAGTGGAMIGAAIVGVIGLLSAQQSMGFLAFVIVSFAGLLASLVDSLLGATVQAQYACVVCGKETEKRHHCDKPSSFKSGYAWINNDVVNILCAGTGVLFAWVGLVLFSL